MLEQFRMFLILITSIEYQKAYFSPNLYAYLYLNNCPYKSNVLAEHGKVLDEFFLSTAGSKRIDHLPVT